jgi:hypothetical protein
MNNRTQQRFDRSIREAVAITRASAARRPRRDLSALVKAMPAKPATPRGRLYLDPETGATVWDPEAS